MASERNEDSSRQGRRKESTPGPPRCYGRDAAVRSHKTCTGRHAEAPILDHSYLIHPPNALVETFMFLKNQNTLIAP